jgi:hypothetical protein
VCARNRKGPFGFSARTISTVAEKDRSRASPTGKAHPLQKTQRMGHPDFVPASKGAPPATGSSNSWLPVITTADKGEISERGVAGFSDLRGGRYDRDVGAGAREARVGGARLEDWGTSRLSPICRTVGMGQCVQGNRNRAALSYPDERD